MATLRYLLDVPTVTCMRTALLSLVLVACSTSPATPDAGGDGGGPFVSDCGTCVVQSSDGGADVCTGDVNSTITYRVACMNTCTPSGGVCVHR